MLESPSRDADGPVSKTGEPTGVSSVSEPDAWWQLQGSDPPGNKSSSSTSSIAPSGFRTLETSSKTEAHLSSGIPRATLRISTRSKWSSENGRGSRLAIGQRSSDQARVRRKKSLTSSLRPRLFETAALKLNALGRVVSALNRDLCPMMRIVTDEHTTV